MQSPSFLNLFVYSDSLAFRREGQSHDLAFLYPFVLKEIIQQRLDVRVNLVLRGVAGATVPRMQATVVRDTGYYGGTDEALNIAVVQCGIVDCAPHPFTYAFAPALHAVPVLGERVITYLVRHRRRLQLTWSYREVSERKFSRAYAAIVRTCRRMHICPVAVGMPIPTPDIEYRSPGFSRSIVRYNELIRQALPDAYCDVESRFSDATRRSLLLEDGHHLTNAGHILYAEALYPIVEQYVNRLAAHTAKPTPQSRSVG